VEQFHAFNELQRLSASPEMAERQLLEVANINVVNCLPELNVPTLVMHCRDDVRVPFSLGQELASKIRGAKFIPLEGKNHLFLAGEPAHRGFLEGVASFLGDPPLDRHLPGTADRATRIESVVKSIEQNWLIKLTVILAAVTGCVVFLLEMWRLAYRH
jgi:hypothetical protein